jgi:hypothetical protein
MELTTAEGIVLRNWDTLADRPSQELQRQKTPLAVLIFVRETLHCGQTNIQKPPFPFGQKY